MKLENIRKEKAVLTGIKSKDDLWKDLNAYGTIRLLEGKWELTVRYPGATIVALIEAFEAYASIEIVKKPLFVSYNLIWTKIQENLKSLS